MATPAPTLLARPTAQSRARSSSIVSVTKIAENYDDVLDGGALTNVNAEWVNYKGAWLIHVVLILVGKILLDILPGLDQDLTWTATNLGYLAVSSAPRMTASRLRTSRIRLIPSSAPNWPRSHCASLQISYIMFHYVTGVPFDLASNSGVYDNLTLWEQIDSGAQYTPAKKWLTTLPIILCVSSSCRLEGFTLTPRFATGFSFRPTTPDSRLIPPSSPSISSLSSPWD